MHSSGAKYIGEWKANLQDGHGVETWEDGSRYEGEYMAGNKHGKGQYQCADESRYDGDWVQNKICGQVPSH